MPLSPVTDPARRRHPSPVAHRNADRATALAVSGSAALAALPRTVRPSTPEVCGALADVAAGVLRAEAGDATTAIGLLAPVAVRHRGSPRGFVSYFDQPLNSGGSALARLRALDNFASLVTVAAHAPAGCYAEGTVRIRRFACGARDETVICDAGPAATPPAEALSAPDLIMHVRDARAGVPAVAPTIHEVLVGRATVDGTAIAGSGALIAWTCEQGSAAWPKTALSGRLVAAEAKGWRRTATATLGAGCTLVYDVQRAATGYVPGPGTLALADGSLHATAFAGMAVAPLTTPEPDPGSVDMSTQAVIQTLCARIAHLEAQLSVKDLQPPLGSHRPRTNTRPLLPRHY